MLYADAPVKIYGTRSSRGRHDKLQGQQHSGEKKEWSQPDTLVIHHETE